QKGVFSKDLILTIIADIGVAGARYKAMEFHGSTIDEMGVDERLTIANMAVEAGAKTALMEPNEKVFEYLKTKVKGSYKPVYADKDASYEKEFHYNAEEIVPVVAEPHLPSNVKPASELEDVEIDQAYLGSCTNARFHDLEIAAKILKGRKVHPNVRLIVVPASKEVYMKALKAGLIEIFLKADAYVSGPTCGACLGGYMGVLAKDEVCISSTNRNFIGRMGHKDSKVYLASPATVAASAITGRITDPREFL
ncbi:MAG TPA: 3-isopropylmalate dehydratase large subunit, partial [Candidatus Altiarchaeales archaeon]|nr:3-isopropylmalate dehydratase large subunit [Candidatus Altiarchaeales archaeon]